MRSMADATPKGTRLDRRIVTDVSLVRSDERDPADVPRDDGLAHPLPAQPAHAVVQPRADPPLAHARLHRLAAASSRPRAASSTAARHRRPGARTERSRERAQRGDEPSGASGLRAGAGSTPLDDALARRAGERLARRRFLGAAQADAALGDVRRELAALFARPRLPVAHS